MRRWCCSSFHLCSSASCFWSSSWRSIVVRSRFCGLFKAAFSLEVDSSIVSGFILPRLPVASPLPPRRLWWFELSSRQLWNPPWIATNFGFSRPKMSSTRLSMVVQLTDPSPLFFLSNYFLTLWTKLVLFFLTSSTHRCCHPPFSESSCATMHQVEWRMRVVAATPLIPSNFSLCLRTRDSMYLSSSSAKIALRMVEIEFGHFEWNR